MRLLKKVTIEGFRSIRNATIEPLADVTAFSGLNNSGKSNVLRALNAFFNDETDAGQYLDVDKDYYRPDLRRKKRKRIRIGVTFELPSNFKFRKGLEGLQTILGGSSFSIAKEWQRGIAPAALSLNGKPLDLEQQQKIAQFLQLIKFRYIPNRVVPTELVRNEHLSLRNILVRRLAQKAVGKDRAFKAIESIAERMIQPLAKRFGAACPGEGAVSLAVPASWNDLAFAFGYRLTRGDIELTDAEQGSGLQSLLMLETLYLIDRDYFQQFGWRQAAIWGLEEPESSMHTSLEARVAAYLAEIAADPKSRLQVLCTTHSDLMVQYAGCTVIAKTQRNGESTFQTEVQPRKALAHLAVAGVSRFVHPILYWPLDPIVLVEGKFDREFFEEAFRLWRPKRQIHVVDLQELDGDAGGGGVDQIRAYIKSNPQALSSRRPDAPVIVILDWDAAGKADSFRKLIKGEAPYKVLVWPESSANPKAGESFRGLERFHSDSVLERAMKEGAPIAKKKNGQYVVEPADYAAVKQALADIVRGGLQPSDFAHSEDFIRKVLEAAGS